MLRSIYQLRWRLAWQTDLTNCVGTPSERCWCMSGKFYFIIWLDCWIKIQFIFTEKFFLFVGYNPTREVCCFNQSPIAQTRPQSGWLIGLWLKQEVCCTLQKYLSFIVTPCPQKELNWKTSPAFKGFGKGFPNHAKMEKSFEVWGEASNSIRYGWFLKLTFSPTEVGAL